MKLTPIFLKNPLILLVRSSTTWKARLSKKK